MGTYDTIGGTPRHDPTADEEGPCGVCKQAVGDCNCPTCPACQEVGNPRCYTEHGLERGGAMEWPEGSGG